MSARRRPVAARPTKPAPVCETCGAELWWAWSIHGKCWTGLAPERHALESTSGTYEVWTDAHGGLLCRYLAPGARGVQDRSWRGLHHNAQCGRWPVEVTTGLVRESLAALPALPDGELLALSHRLREVQDRITGVIQTRAMRSRDEQ